ncbi:hypothetical protein TIFTF001_030812 [Ficus carica]|uniref:Uncharacterized protein n=1 Tax=Ficus carica TaxID=3494 RepID=A0AA88DTW8_FICCA|nr:hypothetical protein TIFTF001_030812 [Ficus carica]
MDDLLKNQIRSLQIGNSKVPYTSSKPSPFPCDELCWAVGITMHKGTATKTPVGDLWLHHAVLVRRRCHDSRSTVTM